MTLKTGWKTTEFWVSAITNFFGLAALFGYHPALPPQVSAVVSAAGAAVTAASTIGYAVSRGLAKANPAAPSVESPQP